VNPGYQQYPQHQHHGIQPPLPYDLMTVSNSIHGGLPTDTGSYQNPELPQQRSYASAAAAVRPAKRMRADVEDRTPVVIAFPKPLPAAERGMEAREFKEETRLALLAEALDGVNRRLKGVFPEQDPPDVVKPSSKTMDVELKQYLDYDQDIVPIPSQGEDTSQRLHREGLNRHIWRRVAARYETDIELARKQYAEARGLIIVNGSPERPNNLHNVGLLWSPVFYYRTTNTVFYGNYAKRAVEHIQSRANTNFEVTERDVVYRMAPRRYPRGPKEIERLVALERNPASEPEDRIGAHILLRAFYMAVSRIDPSLYDNSMKCITDEKAYDPNFYPSFMQSNDEILEFWSMPPSRVSRDINRNHGFGLPTPVDTFDIPGWCRFYLIHHTMGSENAINGITMDYGGRVRIETVFGARLARALSPINAAARTVFTTAFAYLAARPHLYAERIEAYNAENPGSPFRPAPGPPYEFIPSNLGFSEAKNFTGNDLCLFLIKNGVPVSLIDHCYAYGRQFLDNVFFNLGRKDEAIMIDNDRMERLQRYGIPPTIPDWTGWYTPTYDDVRRLKYFYHQNPRGYVLDSPYWIRYGASHLPTVLVSRPNIPNFTPHVWGTPHATTEDDDMDGEGEPEAPADETQGTA
jgi:hypothetical protein